MCKFKSTAAPSVKCLRGANEWDVKSLEIFASIKRFTPCGSPSRMTSSSNGSSGIEGNGVCGYEAKKSIFNERGCV